MNRTEQKHSDIINAATEEFRLHGFEGARTTRIAERANVSSRTLYKHFPTKQALFDQIVEIIIVETGAIASAPYDPEKPLRDQLIKSLGDYIAAITDERYLGLNRMAMTEYLRDQDLARKVLFRAEMSNNPVEAIVAGAIDAEQIEKIDPHFATELLTAGAKAFFFWPQFLVGADSPYGTSDILDECVDMFLLKYQAKSKS